MNKIQNSKIEMFKAVKIHCSRNEQIIASLPALEKVYKMLDQKLAGITGAIQLQEKVITGVVMNKDRDRQLLTEEILVAANALSAYAAQTGDNVLLKETETSLSRLNRMSDESFYRFCVNTIKMAGTKEDLLKEYGLTTMQLSVLSEKAQVFHENSTAPRNAISERSASRKHIIQLIKATNELLTSQMDPLVLSFKKTMPDFYNAYKSNRKTILATGTITQLKGTVQVEKGKKTLTGVRIELLNHAGEIIAASVSNTNGNYQMKGLPIGSFSIRTTDAAQKEKLIPGVEIQLGKVNRLDIAL
jgi:Carboxypeptidase regulatory-like domain